MSLPGPSRGASSRAVGADADIAEAYHGAIDAGEMRRRGIDPKRLIDFSTNVNPFGPSPRVQEAVCRAVLDQYPDRECFELREVLAARLRVPLEHTIVGNGSSELLQNLARALLQPGDDVLIVGPTYSEYARASRLAGARATECTARGDSEFRIRSAEIESALCERRPQIIFLCNPNNPTGKLIDRARLLAWVADHPATHFVVDESYMDFVPQGESVACCGLPNLIVLKSMTKSHALAGVRLGYAVADRQVIDRLCRVRVPWSVSAPAQAAGLAGWEDPHHLERTLVCLEDAKRELLQRLVADGWRPVPSRANFFLLPVGDAAAAREWLLADHLLVRDCHSFGLPEYIRIAARSPSENERLLVALGRAIRGSSGVRFA